MTDSFENRKRILDLVKDNREKLDYPPKIELPDDYFSNCPSCSQVLITNRLDESLYICPICKHHLRMPRLERLKMLFSDYRPMEEDFVYENKIDYPNYEEKLRSEEEKTGFQEALSWGEGLINNHRVIYFVLDPNFIMGSMGHYVGEQISKSMEHAMENKLPLIGISASGGARMQEGIFSLLQMSKTCGALKRFQDQGGLFISMLTDPTTGGVTASYALLGDVNIGEPGALIGFAGPRVIRETIGQNLPEGFQTSESLEKNGFLDLIVSRPDQVEILSRIIDLHTREVRI